MIEKMAQVALSDKQLPVSENEPLINDPNIMKHLLLLRKASVDIRAIQEKLKSNQNRLWSEEVQQRDNVKVRRAGHDGWGIKKCVLLFSDDYIQKVYTFPWYDEWKDLLDPIFVELKIKKEQVIRCLFALMPPQSVIPTHHDTGFWSTKSHRIHVPIFTDQAVDFKGNIYEFNNRCKHSVMNRWDQDRIHLIFDYVEESYPLIHVKLQPGVQLNQTRRSIDHENDFGSRSSPSFLVLGAQKAGTTALYDYITQHPLVVPAKRKETHYFDWRWDNSLPSPFTLEGVDCHREAYHRYFHMDVIRPHPSLMTGEATPSYLLGGKTIMHRVKRIAPQVKLIVMLRNPVDRAFSQYQMVVDTKGNEEQLKNRGHSFNLGRSFEEVIEDDFKELQKYGIHADVDENCFEQYMASRVDYTHGGHSFVGRGLYVLQLKNWLQEFSREDILVLHMDAMKSSETLQTMMQRVFSFLHLPPHVIEDVSPKNTRQYETMSQSTREKLERFYQPFNEKLRELLQESIPWLNE